MPGHSLVLEISYPSCVLQSDKVRLYRQVGRITNRATYIGEQRVIKVMHFTTETGQMSEFCQTFYREDKFEPNHVKA